MYLDWETQARDVYVIDIETDDLDATIIWVMCWKNAKTGEVGECRSLDEIREFFKDRPESVFVGHNILKFDAPTLSNLAGVVLGVRNCIDTLVLSTLYSPPLLGGHSLSAWGERMGNEKIGFNDWSHLSEEMVTYCHQDVAITTSLFRRLIRTMTRVGFSEQSVWLQHRLTVIIEEQRKNGFYFNGPGAIEVYQKLRSREQELEDEIRRVFPGEQRLVAIRPMFTKNGGFTAIYLKDVERYTIHRADDGLHYDAYETVLFNIGSPKQRVDKLLHLGWKPEEFTESGNPKPFDKGRLSPSLERFLKGNDIPEVHMIARWMSVNGRANMINTWLENWNEEDSCIHGKLFVADTLRFRHQSPNTANVPAVRLAKDGSILYGEDGYWTYEARDLWTSRPGRVLVGTDAAGLELRMLAHYLNRHEFTEQVISGDPHQYNADLVGITRPQAKTLIYATLYGAQAPKIAKTLDVSVKEAGKIRELFLERLGVGRLIEECQSEQRNGRITLVDGSKVVCPSPHSALNYKLQGGGARVMGLGTVLLERDIQRRRLDSLKVGDIHDEWQYDVLPRDSEEHATISVEAIREAGRRLKLNVPLDGTAKKGLTWAETH